MVVEQTGIRFSRNAVSNILSHSCRNFTSLCLLTLVSSDSRKASSRPGNFHKDRPPLPKYPYKGLLYEFARDPSGQDVNNMQPVQP